MPQKRRQKEHADVSGKGSSASSGNSGYSASELLTISVTESAVSVIFNIPIAVTWVAMSAFGPLMSANLILVLRLLPRIVLSLAQPMHCMNFFIYLYLMRAFRYELISMLGRTKSKWGSTAMTNETK